MVCYKINIKNQIQAIMRQVIKLDNGKHIMKANTWNKAQTDTTYTHWKQKGTRLLLKYVPQAQRVKEAST